ncbi:MULTISPECIES: ferritin-like domain-containing protein [Maribacter]|uniref:PA2169 family four-helix-bundle protein n=2 Tax=Maribacter TaxID=252356 RepID=A0A5R8M6T9_9FLAO|nr:MULTISPECIES: PA2169 family four-helix-bundle protein [Maribacter]MDC6403754.1 PA2169 family four-helix-bundle protein [Maribacter sp. PR66]MEE1970895.1 PA2169 family four-helix-bundle protein [Maribacter flavus]TLF45190.1 PA2169 family four-helix-bundle protein [Maribacter aurantiacus]
MKYSEKISNRLNDLLTKTYDAEKGYKLAQDKVDNPTVKKFLADKVQQRYNFGHELKREIQTYGELPDKGGSTKGDLHRTWMNLSASLSSNSTERILEEVERGEKASLEEYNEILKDDNMELAPTTQEILIKHRNQIESALNNARIYEEAIS